MTSNWNLPKFNIEHYSDGINKELDLIEELERLDEIEYWDIYFSACMATWEQE